MNTQDEEILELSLNKLSQAMNRLVESCIDDSGKPKSPSMKELMQARAYLPSSCSMSFKSTGRNHHIEVVKSTDVGD